MSEWVQTLLVPFQYGYMLKAIWVSAMIGGVCGFLAPFVTLKGWSLMGDALSHAVIPGVALAYLVGIPFSIGAFFSGLIAAATMGFIRNKTRIREDATIGIVFTTFFALGLLLISLHPAGVDLKMIFLGNILGIAPADILQMVMISAVTGIVLLLKWKDLMLFCFDATQARAQGLPVGLLNALLLSLLAATAVAALQAVGALLVTAMLITPGATAYLLTDRFSRMLWISTGLGVLTSVLGAYISYYLDGATGGAIVCLQAIVFLFAFFFAPKHGVVATRRLANATALPTPSRE